MSMIGNYRRLTPTALNDLLAEPRTVRDVLYGKRTAETPDRHLSIETAWHAIHYLLNGDAWGGTGPLGQAALGGSPVGDEDLGYGPARFLVPREVIEVSRALDGVSPDDLWARFDPEALREAEILPEFDGGAGDREFLRFHYESLRDFFRTAAAEGEAIILYLN